MTISTVAVLGLGSVGRLVAELLQEAGYRVTGFDGRQVEPANFEVAHVDVRDNALLLEALSDVDAVVSCLPHDLNGDVAYTAHRIGIHYFDLTEDVETTKRVMQLAGTSRAVMAPQCGLAPGLVGIVAADLVAKFERCRSLRLRAGALPQHPTGCLGYAFNWSPAGVVNEYLNDCEVIEQGKHKLIPPLERRETIYVRGTKLEAFTTSGGIGSLCSTYLGRVDNVDYKTLRYPGHVDLMTFFFHELLMRERRQMAREILTNAKPPVREDVVYIHLAAEGTVRGAARRHEFVRAYFPRQLCGRQQSAIAWTAAAGVVAVVELVKQEQLPQKGFLRQEWIPFDVFSRTPTGSLYLSCEQQNGDRQ